MCDHCGCRSFPPIAELTAEHEEILDRAWLVAEAVRTGENPRPGDLAELVALLDGHISKEETGLYPGLCETGGLSPDDRAGLEAEHRELRAVLTGGSFDRRAYYALALHIEVEEMELFPAAMLGFDDEEWDAMEASHRSAARLPSGLPS